ncbi:MAG: protein-disulfide reductase DsbD domain-containing protein, partial [Phycisphaerales bacterium JB038]
YLWREAEVRDLLEPRDADLFLRAYGLDQGTNFRDPHDPDFPPANVLFLSKRPEQLAADFDMDPQIFQERLEYCGMRLLSTRDRRDQPRLDDKIITEWNGLMIAGLARAGVVLGEDRYIQNAQRAADFLFEHLTTEEGDLLRIYRDSDDTQNGEAAPIRAGLGDHAALILGLLELYEATGAEATLGRAVLLADQARQRFWDGKHGGYYDTVDRADLIVRARTTYDGAIPSGASLMLGNLIRLAEHTRSPEHRQDARTLLGALSQAIEENPLATANSTRYLAQLLRTQPDLVKQASDPELAINPVAPVQIEVEPATIALAEGDSATLTIRLTMAAGVHINAADPGDPALVPTDVHLVGGEGLALHVEYPTPTRFGVEDAQLDVYQDAAQIIVTLTRAGALGQPRLILTYQPCTERECLTPVHKVLDVEIAGS